MEAVLLDVLEELTDEALSSAEHTEAWAGFGHFFRSLTDRMPFHAGSSARAGRPSNAKVASARTLLRNAGEQLCLRASPCLRAGIVWEDVIFLAQTTSSDTCGLGVEITEDRRQLAVATVLDGMHRNSRQ